MSRVVEGGQGTATSEYQLGTAGWGGGLGAGRRGDPGARDWDSGPWHRRRASHLGRAIAVLGFLFYFDSNQAGWPT